MNKTIPFNKIQFFFFDIIENMIDPLSKIIVNRRLTLNLYNNAYYNLFFVLLKTPSLNF